MSKPIRSVAFSGWPNGMDNVHADYEIPADTLRRAINSDVLDSGKIRRRKGFSPFVEEAGAHSLWSGSGGSAFFVSGQTLWLLFPNGTKQAIGSLPQNCGPLHYTEANGAVYFTSVSARGKIVGGLTLDAWGVDVPVSSPLMVAVPGAMDAGTYRAAITYVLADGRESGASALSSIELSSPGDVGFFGLPVPSSSSVASKRIYLSTPSGQVLFCVAQVAANATTAKRGSFGPELRTLGLSAPPFGTDLDYCLGRLWIASGNAVYGTEALDFDHVAYRKCFYQFPSEVSLIAAASDGLYVCADQTYWISAPGTSEDSMRPVFGFGGIAGTRAGIPNTTDVIWMSERGAIIGHDGGQAEIIAEKRLVPGGLDSAASMVREKDGVRQFVVVGNNAQAASMQCGSYAEAEIIRRQGA